MQYELVGSFRLTRLLTAGFAFPYSSLEKVARLTTTKVELLIFSTLESVLPTIKDIFVLMLAYCSACCPHSDVMKSHECRTGVEM